MSRTIKDVPYNVAARIHGVPAHECDVRCADEVRVFTKELSVTLPANEIDDYEAILDFAAEEDWEVTEMEVFGFHHLGYDKRRYFGGEINLYRKTFSLSSFASEDFTNLLNKYSGSVQDQPQSELLDLETNPYYEKNENYFSQNRNKKNLFRVLTLTKSKEVLYECHLAKEDIRFLPNGIWHGGSTCRDEWSLNFSRKAILENIMDREMQEDIALYHEHGLDYFFD